MGELLALFALIMFSVNIIITKIASSRLNLSLGFMVSIFINIVFASCIFGIQFLFIYEDFQWNYSSLFLFLLSGFFSTYLGRWLFFETIAKMGPAKASAFQVSNPLFTVIIAWIFIGEHLSVIDVGSITVILSGLFLISYVPQVFRSKQRESNDKPNSMSLRMFKYIDFTQLLIPGVWLALLSALSYAIGNVLRGAAIQDWNEPILGALLGAIIGIIFHFTFNFSTKNLVHRIRTSDRLALYLYMLSGILTISAQACSIASMRYLPISIANLITLSTPVLVTPLSYFILKNQEQINARILCGIILVLIGITVIVAL